MKRYIGTHFVPLFYIYYNLHRHVIFRWKKNKRSLINKQKLHTYYKSTILHNIVRPQ